MITLVNGHVQNPSGMAVPNGSISFQLNVDATILAAPNGIIPASQVMVFQFDANGNILPNAPAAAAKIYSNAELNPQNSNGLGTYYLVTFYDQNNAKLNLEPMWWQFPEPANSTVDISQMTPYAVGGGNIIYYPIPGDFSFTASLDLAGNNLAQEVVGILANPLPALMMGYLNWNGTAWAFGSGGIGGSIATGQVAFGSATDTIEGDPGFTYNPVTQAVGGLSGLLITPSLPGTFLPPTVTPSPSGITTWGYTIIARRGVLAIAQTTETQTTTGPATLSVAATNTVAWAALAGATGYDVYRTTAGGTPSTTGIVSANQTGTSFIDTGVAADGGITPEDNAADGGWVGISTGLHVGVPFSSLLPITQSNVDPPGQLANFYFHSTSFNFDGAAIGAVNITSEVIHNIEGNVAVTAMTVLSVNSTTNTHAGASADVVGAGFEAVSIGPAGMVIDRIHGIESDATNQGAADGSLTGVDSSISWAPTYTGASLISTPFNANIVIPVGAVVTDLVGFNLSPILDSGTDVPITSPAGYSVINTTGVLISDCSVIGANTYGVHILAQTAAKTATNWAMKVDDGIVLVEGVVGVTAPIVTRYIDSEPTINFAGSVSVVGSGSIAAVRGNITLAAVSTIAAGYLYGTQGKLTLQGTLNNGSNFNTGIFGQVDTSAAGFVHTSGYLAPIMGDFGATSIMVSDANANMITLLNTTNCIIHSALLFTGNANYLLDATDLAFGGAHFVATQTGITTLAKSLKVRVDGVDYYIPLCTGNS